MSPCSFVLRSRQSRSHRLPCSPPPLRFGARRASDRRRNLRGAAALAAVGLLLAACGGDKKGGSTTVASVPATAVTTAAPTTAAPTTTGASSTTGTGVTTTTAPAEPVMPLTGLPITDPALASRQALVVKIDNHPDARPQSGLAAADLVYEENVEQLTRFAAVFQTNAPDPVGPIRSGRTQDVLLLGSLNKPIFAWSGGNGGVTAAINGSDFFVVRVDAKQFSDQAGTYRANDRGNPHNLYSTATGLFSLSPEGAEPPPQQFQYLAAGQPAAGDPSPGVQLAMDGVNVAWNYDQSTSTYARSQDGKPHVDREGGPIQSSNVVVLTVDYQPSVVDAHSPEAQTIGTGDVTVYTGGKAVSGTWTRDDRNAVFTLTAADGSPIRLTPGNTWVELARAGAATPLT
jgi:hypothetical protein